MDDAVEVAERQPAVAYATFTLRARAVFTDVAVCGVALAVIIVASLFAEDVPGSGRILLVAILGVLFLYEPILVWRYGGTLGHRRANIRVVSDRTHGNPSFLAAFARFLIKSLLGLPSFVAMAFTRRHQAIHDVVTHTTVQIRDLASAPEGLYVAERDASDGPPPPVWRRLVAILVYSVLAYLAMSIVAGVALSHGCAVNAQCTPADQTMFAVVGLAWLGSEVAIVAQGWRGRLWGARIARTEEAGQPEPPAQPVS